MKRYRQILISIFIICIVLLALNFPFNLVIAPQIKLKFVDIYGNPIRNGNVRQHWYQYSLDESGGEDIKIDSNGEVLLHKRAVRTSLIGLIYGAIYQTIEMGIHASYCSSSSIIIFIPGYPVNSTPTYK